MKKNKDFQFKFNIEEDKFIWGNKYYRIIFSDGHIEPHHEILYPKSINDIMYFYYGVKIQKRIIDDFEKETYKWKTVCKNHISDFPGIEQLKYILEELPTINVVEDGEKHIHKNGDVLYSKHYWTQGFGCEDFYEFTRFVDSNNKTSHYIGYLGAASGCGYAEDSNGIRLTYLTDNDLNELKKCVDSFIEDVIKVNNEKEESRINELRKSFKIKNHKLYCYFEDGSLEYIITENSVCNLYYEELDKNNNIIEKDYGEILIDRIENNCLYSKDKEFQLDKITYFYEEVSDEKLLYNEEEIMEDFIDILDDEDKKDFINLSIEELINKYTEAIINRTWMCRSEHNFMELFDETESDRNIKTAKIIAKCILKDIKEFIILEKSNFSKDEIKAIKKEFSFSTDDLLKKINKKKNTTFNDFISDLLKLREDINNLGLNKLNFNPNEDKLNVYLIDINEETNILVFKEMLISNLKFEYSTFDKELYICSYDVENERILL